MIKVFLCYGHEDFNLKEELKKHLQSLQRQRLLEIIQDSDIAAGTEWKQKINQYLNEAKIILLLVSSDLIASDYLYHSVVKRAMERHRSGEARVIPVILRPVNWQDDSLFGSLMPLPTDGVPVIDQKWHHQDNALHDITQGIRKIVDDLNSAPSVPTAPPAKPQPIKNPKGKTPQKAVKQYLDTIDTHCKQKNYEKALAACSEALRLDASNAYIYERQSYILYKQGKYEEALEVCEKAIARNLSKASIFANQGAILNELARYPEALTACNRAIHLETSYIEPYIYKSSALYKLQRYDDAVKTCEQAIQLKPSCIDLYIHKSSALYKLQRYDDAVRICEQALQHNAYDIHVMNRKSRALLKLERYSEVVKTCEQVLQLDPSNPDAIKYKTRAIEHPDK